MTKTLLPAIAIAVFCLSGLASADIVTYDNVQVRPGLFGPGTTNMTLNSINGGAIADTTADPLTFSISVTAQDFDGDGTANDTFSFDLIASGGGAAQRVWGQGIDTGFGNLNAVTFTVGNVVGTTTDSGDSIVFDGFTAATAAMGAGDAFARNVDVNGTTVNLTTTGGGFQFVQQEVSFGGAVSSVLFDNSGGTGGSIVARAYDLQFSSVAVAVPEPTSLALMGMVGGLFALRRRK